MNILNETLGLLWKEFKVVISHFGRSWLFFICSGAFEMSKIADAIKNDIVNVELLEQILKDCEITKNILNTQMSLICKALLQIHRQHENILRFVHIK